MQTIKGNYLLVKKTLWSLFMNGVQFTFYHEGLVKYRLDFTKVENKNQYLTDI